MGLFRKKESKLRKKLDELKDELKEKQNIIQNQENKINALETQKQALEEKFEILEEELDKESVIPLIKRPRLRNLVLKHFEIVNKSWKIYCKWIKGTEADLIILTDNDCDGVVSGALLQGYFGNKYRDMRIFHIDQSLRDLILTVQPKREMVTADLVIDKRIAEYSLKLHENGVKVTLIDHHPGSLNIGKRLISTLEEKQILILYDAPSAAAMVRDYYGLNDEKSQRICSIANICDTYTKPPLNLKEDIDGVSRLCILDPMTLDKTRTELANHGSIQSIYLKNSMKAVDMLSAFTREFIGKPLYNTKHFQLFFLKEGTPRFIGLGYTLNKLARRERKDVYCAIEKNGFITIRGRSKSINVSEIFSRMAEDLGGISYGRGGIGGCKFLAEEDKMERVRELLSKSYHA